jgi:hypothetical protein
MASCEEWIAREKTQCGERESAAGSSCRDSRKCDGVSLAELALTDEGAATVTRSWLFICSHFFCGGCMMWRQV